MKRSLNIENVTRAMHQKGFSPSRMAERLGVQGDEVSGWLQGKALPRPKILLDLDRLLGLGFDALVTIVDPEEPRVAFRKKKGAKTQDHHIEKAIDMGRLLRELVPFSPFAATQEAPLALESPCCDYVYLQQSAADVRNKVGLGRHDIMEFGHLLDQFHRLHVVVVPVLWGTQDRHENAVHLHLPESRSTWVYLNLDTHLHDFKFWIAHELAHCLSPTLEGDEAEDFADAFAGCLLYPHDLSEIAYHKIAALPTTQEQERIQCVIRLARDHTLSPISVLRQANAYAVYNHQPEIDLGNTFHGHVTNFNKGFQLVSHLLLSGLPHDEHDAPSARDYITKVEGVFKTPFFTILRSLLQEKELGPGFIQAVLDIPYLDAQSIHTELCGCRKSAA